MKELSVPVNHLDFSWIDGCDVFRCQKYCIYKGYDSGDEPALLFVHGGYHGAWCFSHYLQYFANEKTACYAVDLSGHGSLFKELTPDLDIVRLGRDLIDCVDRLGRPIVLVAHSLGALPALLVAQEVDLAGLILLAPSPPGNLPGGLGLPAVPNGMLKAPPEDNEIRLRFLADKENISVASVRERLCAESPTALNDRYLSRIVIHPENINCPGICFEAGLDDPLRHPKGQDERIAEFLSLEYKLLSNQPHCMMYGERWEESAKAIKNWYLKLFK